MSDTFLYVFPADPLMAKPDWAQLKHGLLERGLVAVPKEGPRLVYSTDKLWSNISQDLRLESDHSACRSTSTLAGILAILRQKAVVPPYFVVDTTGMSIPQFAEALKQGGYLSPGFVPSFDEELHQGASFASFCDLSQADNSTVITYIDAGSRMAVHCGDSLQMHPGIPGTDRVLEDGLDFLSRWCEDPAETWCDPETGRRYGLFDLDWESTLAAGRCMLEFLQPGYLNAPKVAELLQEISGQPWRFAFTHI
jgi:hypothetical protein